MADPRELLRQATGFRGLADLLRQRSIRDGLWGGRRNWLAVGAVVWGIRGVRKAIQRNEQVLLREIVPPGATLLVTEAITRPTRKQKRRLARKK